MGAGQVVWRAISTIVAAVLFCLAGLGGPVLAQKPRRLTELADLPEWLSARGINQSRYESLEGQFRPGLGSSDQALLMRTVYLVEVDTGPVSFGVEVQDSRGYFDDTGSALSSSFVNPVDILQAYGRIDLPGVGGAEASSSLTLGRVTLDIGGRRWVARNGFRNAINGFMGAHWQTRWEDGRHLHAFGTVVVDREPDGIASLTMNELEFDRERFNQRFWAAHYIQPGAFGDVQADLFVYGFDESDSDHTPETLDRRYVWAGMRLFRKPRRGAWDFDFEGAYRLGRISSSRDPAVLRDLRVRAAALHAELGFTFDTVLRPRFAVTYDRATGDDNADDTVFGTWDTLFSARRGDLGHSSLHGPLNRQNLNAPGARLDIKAGSRLDGRLFYNAGYLESPTDVWDIPGIVDPTGQSGQFVGHSLNGRLRYWLIPRILRGEIGGSVFVLGRFAETAPGVTGQGDTAYGYVQLTTFF